MVSRVTSFDSLLILQDFDRGKISCHQSEETHLESKRLKILWLCTIMRCGSNDQVIEAERHLHNLHQPITDDAELEGPVLIDTHDNPNNLLDHLQTTQICTSKCNITQGQPWITKCKWDSDRGQDSRLGSQNAAEKGTRHCRLSHQYRPTSHQPQNLTKSNS